MASILFTSLLLLLAVTSLVLAHFAAAGDPDILTDFTVPSNVTYVDGNFFTYTGMRVLMNAPPPTAFKILKVSVAEFPALNGQSVSYAFLQFPAGNPNPPHIHPRSAELLFLTEGSLQVGLVDTTNKLFTQTIEPGDMFIFPKGLMHFQYNPDSEKPAFAISAFGSANAGTVSFPVALFAAGVDDNVLAKSF